MKNNVNVHSYIKSKPVHGVTCLGIMAKAKAKEKRAATKQSKTDTAPRQTGSLDSEPLVNCLTPEKIM